jgi:large repetitive protein
VTKILASMRMKLALVLTLISAIAVSGAAAADFEKDAGSGADCTEPAGGGFVLKCPTAAVGHEYEAEMESEEGSGCTSPGNPYVWYEVVNSALPPGLTMSRAGVISGTPTTAGFYRFWVWNHDLTAAEGGPDWCQNEDRSEVEFSISVDPGLMITSDSVEPGTLGQPYSETFTAQQVSSLNPSTGSDVQATWSLAAGVLPPGLALSSAGLLSGTPTAEGSWQFEVAAQTGGQSDTETFAISVRQSLVVTSPFAPAPRPSAEVGILLGKSAKATGGSGSYTWSVSAGALPPGLTLDPAKGTITGTPTAAGSFRFVLTASDTEGRRTSANSGLSVAARLAVTTARLKGAKVGRRYGAAIRTAGGVKPVKWARVSGKLPAGIKLSQTRGTLTGTPTKAGTYRVTVEARDALGATSKKRLVLTVHG